jgi:hypothetical protein
LLSANKGVVIVGEDDVVMPVNDVDTTVSINGDDVYVDV